MHRDYAPRGVKFYYIYKSLAHPEHNGYVRPLTFEERLMHVREAQRTLGSEFAWLCDGMQNDLKHNLGNAPNSEFIIDPQGLVVRKRSWSDPGQVRKDLEELVGPVESPTTVADLNLKTEPPPRVAPKGIVERPTLPGRMTPLMLEAVPEGDGQPFYAKLRAEAEGSLLQQGRGKLYLGFHMDPLYHVHWNNLTKPVRVTLEPEEGIELSETELSGPKVKEPSDIDPREFLIDVDRGDLENGSIRVSVDYFACNDEQEWCKAVSQEYIVHLKADGDGGRANRRRSRQQDDRRPANARRRQPPADSGNRAFGRIAAIDPEKRLLTVQTRNRRKTEYKVADSARIMRKGKRGQFSDFNAGEFVMLRFERSKNVPPIITGLVQRPAPPHARRKQPRNRD